MLIKNDWNRFSSCFVWCLMKMCASLSTLCDNLRRERDRAVSDLADALRNLDDTRKQKNDTARELKELKWVILLHLRPYTALILGFNLNVTLQVSSFVRTCACFGGSFLTRSFVPPSGGIMSLNEQSWANLINSYMFYDSCREKIEDQLEKEASFRQLMAHSSHDSAIDTDSMEWETEVVEIEKHRVRTTACLVL